MPDFNSVSRGLNISKVDFHYEENNKEHHTNEISIQRLIVRRGQSFKLSFNVGRPFRPNDEFFEMIAETGPDASESMGTKSVFGLTKSSGSGKGKPWSMEVQRNTDTTVTLSVLCPADASVGQYSLSVRAGSSASRPVVMGKLLVLFNPWCKEDWVYLPQETERQEYVMNENGCLYQGSDRHIKSHAWDFGQFEDNIVDICLKLLDVNPKCLRNAREDFSARCNPIYVSRVVSAMVNANDDKGVLMGRWHEPYSEGVSPSHWDGSVEILRKWFDSDCRPVKYGQCWVFTGVMCTVLRCLGIPCRPVTNFQSAHDTNANLTIDEYFSESGANLKNSPDSIWNYHVWVEAWMKRPDLSATADYDGWQVVDPTPQEKSEGTYCCGPAPVKAILEGHTNIKYDVPFVFAEVNADIVNWMVMSDGSKKKVSTDKVSVGQNMSTKAVGRDVRVDITSNYKYQEGSKREREVFNEAVGRLGGHIPDVGTGTGPRKITVKIEEVSKPALGLDINLKTVLHNNSSESQTLSVHLNAQAMRYTGVVAAAIWNGVKEIELLPGKAQSLPITIPFSSYGEKLLDNNSIKVSVIATNKRDSNETYLAQKDIVLQSPPLKIVASGTAQLFREAAVEVIFENPLPSVLRNCSITVSGSGLLQRPVVSRFELGPDQKMRMKLSFFPYRQGPKKLVATFDCSILRDIKASCDVNVLLSN
ncbi:protein-glutamine gamma-glutamyltransferase 2-like [Chanos chanos]|uniref:Protein-glutamine gamma-glutamyltransferase 2 n=1 Tax=Chanos chanos TaxID=29144 RepID=A0A6J2VPA3_CHACN|nr:protein-glutamine gamma-glutamyltransferase 2-like [Chanos chanos]